MRQTCGTQTGPRHARARGGARLNFLIVLSILVAGGYVGYQIVPLYYRASLLKAFMQDTVNMAAAAGKKGPWVEQQLRGNADDYGVPQDALIETTTRDGRMEAHVQFTSSVPLLVTTYQYTFDHTVKSSTIGVG